MNTRAPKRCDNTQMLAERGSILCIFSLKKDGIMHIQMLNLHIEACKYLDLNGVPLRHCPKVVRCKSPSSLSRKKMQILLVKKSDVPNIRVVWFWSLNYKIM
jgi:hypothetical protein